MNVKGENSNQHAKFESGDDVCVLFGSVDLKLVQIYYTHLW